MPQQHDPNSATTSRMPAIYRPPAGGPLRWQDDVTGVLPKAVLAYVAHMIHRTFPLSDEQLELVRDYCQYYINAPCWQTTGAEQTFADLRARITDIHTAEALGAWMMECLHVGIDPL